MPESVYFEQIKSDDPFDLAPYSFGRYIHRDSRSLDYQVQTSHALCKWWPWYRPKPKPVMSVEWEPVIEALDQGELGSCTGNAAAHALATPAVNHEAIDFVSEDIAVSIYSSATHIDTYQGAWPPEDTGSSGLAVAKVLQTLGYIRRYEHAYSLQQVRVAVQTTPLLVGLSWRQEMYQPERYGWVDYRGPVVGGHEVLLTGWYPPAGNNVAHFTFRNSWGPQWGYDGDFIMSETDFQKVLDDGGDVIRPIWEL